MCSFFYSNLLWYAGWMNFCMAPYNITFLNISFQVSYIYTVKCTCVWQFAVLRLSQLAALVSWAKFVLTTQLKWVMLIVMSFTICDFHYIAIFLQLFLNFLYIFFFICHIFFLFFTINFGCISLTQLTCYVMRYEKSQIDYLKTEGLGHLYTEG